MSPEQKHADLVSRLEAFYMRYLSFADPSLPFVAALWSIATHLWPHFDAFPYLVITSATKRSGKTRLSELLGFTCSNPRNFTAATPVTMFRIIRDEKPTLIMDEAEDRSSDAVDTMRQIVNAGYRRGQTIPRASSKTASGIEEWPVYCPKVFVLIGDPTDTLRDRSIMFWMRRGLAPMRFVYSIAEAEGNALRDDTADTAAKEAQRVTSWYLSPNARLEFLDGREEEIWLPVYAVAQALVPGRLPELRRAIVDLSADKTRTAASFRELAGAEDDAEADEFAQRLLLDLGRILTHQKHRGVFSESLIEQLQAIDVAPWRKFRGTGLTPMAMADLLSRFPNVKPVLLKIRGKVARGYRRESVLKAIQAAALEG